MLDEVDKASTKSILLCGVGNKNPVSYIVPAFVRNDLVRIYDTRNKQ